MLCTSIVGTIHKRDGVPSEILLFYRAWLRSTQGFIIVLNCVGRATMFVFWFSVYIALEPLVCLQVCRHYLLSQC